MKLKNIGIGDFIEAKNKHGGDVGFDILEIGKSYEVLGLNENSDFTVVISVPEHKTFCSGFYVCHEYFRKPRPQLKQLDQSVFDGLDEKWRFAAVDKYGYVGVFDCEPAINCDEWYEGHGMQKGIFDNNYDTSNWQNSLIERDTAELMGSDLCEVIIVTMQKYQPCYISDISDEHALKNKVAMLVDNIYTDGRDYKFRSNLVGSRYAVPINNQGEPLTASEAGL